MSQSQTAPQDEGLLPSGTVVELEIYYAVVHIDGKGETHALTVTCDTLKKMLVIEAATLANILSEHNIEMGSQRCYREMAVAFQRQCAQPEPALWKLVWNQLLDRRLLCVVKLEIQ